MDIQPDSAYVQKLPAPALFGRLQLVDLQQALMLCLMGTAFGLGIAEISNFPPMAGIVSAVVGGLIGSLFGRAPTLICGSAAALAPILAMSVNWLGGDNWEMGYERTLVVIFLTGCLMVTIGRLGWARYIQSLFSDPIIHGMLASIAIILLSGRLSTLMGVKLDGHTLHQRIIELASKLGEIDLAILTVAVGIFTFLFAATYLQGKVAFLRKFPPQVLAIPLTLVLATMVSLPDTARINLPENLWTGLRQPDFWGALTDPMTILIVLFLTLFLTLVDTAETVGTAVGITKIDRHERTVDVNRLTTLMGVANVVSSISGGMSNIPGGAKSTMAVILGVQRAWVGIIAALLVAVGAYFGREILNLLPQAGLAAIIVFSVMKLCSAKIWRYYYRQGSDQFVVFLLTFVGAVVTNDILVGILLGIVSQFVVLYWLTHYASDFPSGNLRNTTRAVVNLWFNPTIDINVDCMDGACDVHLGGTWVFFKSEASFAKLLEQIPKEAKLIRLHIGADMVLIDAPTMNRFREWVERNSLTHTLKICPTSLVSVTARGTHYRSRSA